MKKKKNKAENKIVSYKIELRKDSIDHDIRWIICQHCGKPVYGTRSLKGVVLPNKELLKKFEWKAPSWKRSGL